MTGTSTAERRARRLLRLYPPGWRARYGEELVQLLVDDMSERPRSPSRTVDVLRTGVVARLAAAGLAGDELGPEARVRAALGALGLAVAAFLAAGIALWAQLTVGWQWSAPSSPTTRAGMIVMSATMLAFGVLAVAAALPLLGAACRQVLSGRGRGLIAPLATTAAGGLLLVLGSIHFGHGWPGTGGHPWAGRDIVPGGVARFSWAATLWITSYWAHPGALASFPASEVAWMIASPLATVAVVLGAAKGLRRLPLSARVLRYEAWVGSLAAVAMAGFLAGAASWAVSGGSAPRGLFRVGAIDLGGVVVMALALVVAFRVAQRALATPSAPAPALAAAAAARRTKPE